jgi:hypothetical protein
MRRLRGPDRVAAERAHPEDERQQRGVSDHEHPLIIIARLSRMSEDATVGRLVALASGALRRGDARAFDPIVLRFLLRAHASADHADLGPQLESAFGIALERLAEARGTVDRARWLTLFVDVSGVSDDARVREAVERLAAALAREWPFDGAIDDGSASVEACLRASAVLDPEEVVPAAIDELERLAARAYRPGQALGSVGIHVRLGSALLTAFGCTERIPYAMLSEELVQSARRAWWDGAARRFDAPFDVNCDAAGVLYRLAALHRDPQYVSAAVVAAGADYDGDAAAILSSLEARLPLGDAGQCAAFGLALLERRSSRFR